MPNMTPSLGAHVRIEKPALQRVFDALKSAGYTLVGPTLGEGAIIYDEIDGLDDLPKGWTDRHGPATYRLEQRQDDAYFGYVVGPHAWKKFLFPPRQSLFKVRRDGDSFEVEQSGEPAPDYAFIGVRGCELQAIHIQDKVYLGGPYQDPVYKARRSGAFILAVNCTEPGETCFCTSMGTGPKAGPGFDLALTELDEVFVIEIGSEMGATMLQDAGWRPASAFELEQTREAIKRAEQNMGRRLDISDLPNLLYDNLEHERWDQVAARCLSCANCTMVCPTCFCSDVQEVSDLQGQNFERIRVWDSCFTLDFSHVHGGNTRPHTRSRYRQWLTHKFASWIDQFDVIGCVGCGRCITWCPVGIDVTEEIAAIRGEV